MDTEKLYLIPTFTNWRILRLKGLLFMLSCLSASLAGAQHVSLNYSIYEETLRRSQLLGEVDSLLSFTIRPIVYHNKLSIKGAPSWFGKSLVDNRKLRTKFIILPVQLYSEFNSHHPYGWNNGSLLRSKGLQSQLAGGFFSSIGPLHIQVQPEFNFIQNGVFDGYYRENPTENSPQSTIPYYYGHHFSRIDLPEGFGSEKVTNLLPGQSSIKLSYGGVAVGVSTANIWWGPGKRNSLLMSNNARGFAHATLNTTRPAKTLIGAFEGQVIIGRLESSGYLSPQGGVSVKKSAFNTQSEDWRYLSGLNFSYNPKWSPGLFLGFTRTIQQPYVDTKEYKDYFPVVMNLLRENDDLPDYLFNRDQYLSVYLRWLWRKAHAEWYLEFGRNDASYNLRDAIMTPEHSRAFTFGMVKLIPLARDEEFIQVATEITQLQQSVNYVVRDAGNWYTHFQVREGYTHRGEVLGAGIGPGSNVQFLEVSWLRKMDKLGVQFERLVTNNDFYYATFPNTSTKQPWVDLSLGINGNRKIENFLLSGKIQYIRSFNYWWEEAPESTPFAYKGKDVSNLFLTFGVIYGFR